MRAFVINQDELAAIIAKAGDEGWTTLDLSDKGLKFLPSEIGNLTSLTELRLSDNQLTALPPGMKRLMNRGVVKLSGNPLLEKDDEEEG